MYKNSAEFIRVWHTLASANHRARLRTGSAGLSFSNCFSQSAVIWSSAALGCLGLIHGWLAGKRQQVRPFQLSLWIFADRVDNPPRHESRVVPGHVAIHQMQRL